MSSHREVYVVCEECGGTGTRTTPQANTGSPWCPACRGSRLRCTTCTQDTATALRRHHAATTRAPDTTPSVDLTTGIDLCGPRPPAPSPATGIRLGADPVQTAGARPTLTP